MLGILTSCQIKTILYGPDYSAVERSSDSQTQDDGA